LARDLQVFVEQCRGRAVVPLPARQHPGGAKRLGARQRARLDALETQRALDAVPSLAPVPSNPPESPERGTKSERHVGVACECGRLDRLTKIVVLVFEKVQPPR